MDPSADPALRDPLIPNQQSPQPYSPPSPYPNLQPSAPQIAASYPDTQSYGQVTYPLVVLLPGQVSQWTYQKAQGAPGLYTQGEKPVGQLILYQPPGTSMEGVGG